MSKSAAKKPEPPAAPCPVCVEHFKRDLIRYEAIQPLRGGALDSIANDGRKQCRDCEFAETMVRVNQCPTFLHARVAVGNHRSESMRLPGITIGLGMIGARVSEPGEFEKHLEWLGIVLPDDPAENC